jgi:uncharacterized iron-regulated protein
MWWCVLVLAFFMAAADPAAGVEAPPGAWQAPLGRDHPLAGRIRDVRADRFIEPAELIGHLTAARYVLLGEKHDNPDHHRLQAYLLKSLIAAGRRPAVAFEMFDADAAPAIERHLAAHPADAAGLADAVNWKASGWPDWVLYQPIAEAALDAGLPIVAANLPRAALAALRRGGAAGLDPALVARWHLADLPPADVRESLAREIRDAHCGHGSDAMVDRMVAVQRARDARMAAAMAEAAADGAVLIAGAGHARTDRGVPAVLRARAPAASIASVAFVEVAPGTTTPESYAVRYGAASLPFDYVWYTPRVEDVDPCEKFKKSLEGIRQRQ